MNPADIFGKVRVVQWNGFVFTLSLIRWGILRRYRARRGKLTFFDTGASFIPKYEIAVYEGAPSVNFSKAPEMVFYYPDKTAALLRFRDLESVIVEGGLDGAPMRDFIQDANPQRQHSWVLRGALNQILTEVKVPKGPRGLTKSAVAGAEMRHSLFGWLEEFETETGEIGGFSAADGFFYHRQLIDWFQKRHGLPESKQFLESVISLAFSTPEKKCRLHKEWPTILARYQGMPNTEDVLIDKADRLSNYIILHLGIATELYRMNIEVSPDKCLEINAQVDELVKLEETALWFRMINDLANTFIRGECRIFMPYLEDSLGYHLAVQGALPQAIVDIVGTRINEYASYQKFVADPKGSWAGTVLWAAGKHLMEALRLRPSAIFQVHFENLFLTTVKGAMVGELLTGQMVSSE